MTTVTDQLNALRQICIIYCGDADRALKTWVEKSLLPDSWLDREGDIAFALGQFNDLFSKDDLPTRWETNTNLTTYDVESFEDELRVNLLNKNADDRILYMKVVGFDIEEFLKKDLVYWSWSEYYSSDYLKSNNISINYLPITEYLLRALLQFRHNLRLLSALLTRINQMIDRYSTLFDINTSQSEQPSRQPQSPEPGAKLQWKGGKTDLAELVWALAKSGRITDSATGRPVTQKELTSEFETLFGLSINTMGLMQGRKDSYKAADDGVTFTSALSELVDTYIDKK